MNQKPLLGYIAIVVLFGAAACGLYWQTLVEKEQVRTVFIDELRIRATVADTLAARAKGLSGRTSLPEGEGMLFIFKDDAAHGIWMKDMLFPIDILWVSKEKQVVHIESNVSPDSYPNVFRPPYAARYVVELPAGAAQRNSVVNGSEVEF
ncbi:DUF192 domain-containing protein [Candidatus Kaiserbacteria bacterium]|nr:DUF192 domain-containing protein [Candidatus Kaiserbacteria bacterium]